MSIVRIDIENYKSIRKCCIDMNELNIIIGENGCGKTNIVSALSYFYDNLVRKKDDDKDIFDRNNKFNNRIKIGITYSFKEFRKIYHSQLSKGKDKYIVYYDKILRILHGQEELYVELTKIKGMPIKWNIQSLENRQIIYNIFPFYFVNVRELNLINWEDLWSKVGDLVKVEDEIASLIRKNTFDIIDNDIENNYKLYSKFKLLKKALQNSNIGVKKYTPQEFGTALAKTYFQGDKFIFSDQKLSYFSTGTNSFNYINMLIEITNAIRIKKIKFPTIIMDEPELGLHHKFIDMLTDKILYNCKRIQFILCTHSARLVKNVFKDTDSSNHVINLKYKDKYTICNKMNHFEEARQFCVITDDYVNAYFSKMLLLVEGESELELFNNRYLKELYPVLKSIDVVYCVSNQVLLEMISPRKRNYQAEYLTVEDMDKIIKPCKQQKEILNQFNLQTDDFKKNNMKERFYYGEKRKQTLEIRKRIENMLAKCKFHYKLPFYSTTDSYYYELIKLIKQYFLNYNTFVFRTTIEGALINYDNYAIFWDFFEKRKLRQDQYGEKLKQLYIKLSRNDKVNLLRLLVNGKSDYILNLEELANKGLAHDKFEKLKEIIQRNRLRKTKWITEWLEFYFDYIMKQQKITDEEVDFKRGIFIEEYLQLIRSEFFHDFKELTVLINCVYKKYYC